MKVLVKRNVVILLLLFMKFYLTGGIGNAATTKTGSYHYSAKMECLSEPEAPLYNGGLLTNPGFDHGIRKWRVYGQGKTELPQSATGNKFVAPPGRTQQKNSLSHKLNLEKDLHYSFSAWVQVNQGRNVMVSAGYRDVNNKTAGHGSVLARSGCWSFLKGGFTLNSSMSIELYFESESKSVELWVDSIALQPFTKDQWRNHQLRSIENIRKRKVRIHVSNQHGGDAATRTSISLENIRPSFPLGCGLASTIIDNRVYQDWFAPRFTVATFDNEMKWYYTERSPGMENYTDADAMLAFAKKHGISVRGHNIFWDNANQNKQWVKSLSDEDLMAAARRRLDSLLSRYSDDVIAWDVMNENLHFSFFEDRLGPNATALFFNLAHKFNPKTLLFMNEFNTLEYRGDQYATPAKYLKKIEEIKSYPGNENLTVAIGLEGHFGEPDMAYVRACLDVLGASGMPIWITELDVERGPDQAVYLEEIMREVYSHPAVEGIIVWGGWRPNGCSNMCLTDNFFKNLPAGDVVDKLIAEWKTEGLIGETDGNNGVLELNIFHGEYLITAASSSGKEIKQKLDVSGGSSEPMDIWITI